MRFTYDTNDIKDNEKVACLRVMTVNTKGEPSVMMIPVVIDKNEPMDAFVSTVNVIECDDTKPESIEELCNFEMKDINFRQIAEDIETDFPGCLESFTNELMVNVHNEINLIPRIDKKWKINFYNELERFAKGIEDDDLDPKDFKFMKHNLFIIVKSKLPTYKELYQKYFEESLLYSDKVTLKIHLVLKEILKVIDQAADIFEKML